MLDVIINNFSMKKLGVYVAERPNIPTPMERIKKIEVDGRDGFLTQKKGFDDIQITVEFNVLEDFNIKPLLRQIKARLLDAETLVLSDDDVYYRIKDVKVLDIQNQVDFYGRFVVDFECDPFQYRLGVGTITLTAHSNSLIVNPGTYFSLPRLTVFGTGSGEVTINNTRIQIRNLTNHIIIDSETMIAYRGTINLNSSMIGEFPKLEVGDNLVSFDGGITRIDIIPRWRYR